MKLPVRFDETAGTINDAEDKVICHTLYFVRTIDRQKQDMRDIVEAVNRTEDGQDKDGGTDAPAVPVERKP